MSTTGETTVVRAIDRILAWSKERESRIGYFAALYRHVATNLSDALTRGEFEHPEWMEQVNEQFFGRYLDAFDRFERGEPCTLAWQTAFEATRSREPIVVQHLLLGANAHINLDLSIGVAHTIPPEEMARFRPDYEHMNDLICSLIAEVSADVGRVLPLVKLLSRIGEHEEDLVIAFSIRRARQEAWVEAQRLAVMAGEAREEAIRGRDARVAAIGRRILAPGLPVGLLLPLLRIGEQRSVRETIEDLLR